MPVALPRFGTVYMPYHVYCITILTDTVLAITTCKWFLFHNVVLRTTQFRIKEPARERHHQTRLGKVPPTEGHSQQQILQETGKDSDWNIFIGEKIPGTTESSCRRKHAYSVHLDVVHLTMIICYVFLICTEIEFSSCRTASLKNQNQGLVLVGEGGFAQGQFRRNNFVSDTALTWTYSLYSGMLSC